MSYGPLNRAADPVPSVLPPLVSTSPIRTLSLLPAIVDTTPVGVILRIRLLSVSAT